MTVRHLEVGVRVKLPDLVECWTFGKPHFAIPSAERDVKPLVLSREMLSQGTWKNPHTAQKSKVIPVLWYGSDLDVLKLCKLCSCVQYLLWIEPDATGFVCRSFLPFVPLLVSCEMPSVQLWALFGIGHVCSKNGLYLVKLLCLTCFTLLWGEFN